MTKVIDNGFFEGDQGILAGLYLLKTSNSELSRWVSYFGKLLSKDRVQYPCENDHDSAT